MQRRQLAAALALWHHVQVLPVQAAGRPPLRRTLRRLGFRSPESNSARKNIFSAWIAALATACIIGRGQGGRKQWMRLHATRASPHAQRRRGSCCSLAIAQTRMHVYKCVMLSTHVVSAAHSRKQLDGIVRMRDGVALQLIPQYPDISRAAHNINESGSRPGSARAGCAGCPTIAAGCLDDR